MQYRGQVMGKGIGGHTRPNAGWSDDWLTPLSILQPLGRFDLDPCAAPFPRPWPTASEHFVIPEGLIRPWRGRVWLNPPYGKDVGLWLAKLADHGRGTALVFARTDTKWFHEHVWAKADGLLFLRGRITFCRPDCSLAPHNSGGPSVLIAYGERDANMLATCGLDGEYIRLTGR